MFMGTVRTDLRTLGNICTLALILTLMQKSEAIMVLRALMADLPSQMKFWLRSK
jgi:hypothetical protein